MIAAKKKIIKLITEPIPVIPSYKVSLKKACREVGKASVFDSIADRIQEEAKQTPELFDYIYVNLPGKEFDIHLESDGVFFVGSILMEFWNEDDVMSLYRYLRSLDKEVDIKNKVLYYARHMPEDTLWESLEQLSVEDGGDAFVTDAITAELEKRRTFKACITELRNAGGCDE